MKEDSFAMVELAIDVMIMVKLGMDMMMTVKLGIENGGGRWRWTAAGKGRQWILWLKNNENLHHQGPLVIKDVSKISPKLIKHVEGKGGILEKKKETIVIGKGKGILQEGYTEEDRSNGMKVILNGVAVKSPSKIVNPEAMQSAQDCMEKVIEDHQEIDLQQPFSFEQNKKLSEETGVVKTNNSLSLKDGNSFIILRNLEDEEEGEIVQINDIEEEAKEFSSVKNIEERTIADFKNNTVNDLHVEESFVNKGGDEKQSGSQSSKKKISKQLKSLGPISSSTRLRRLELEEKGTLGSHPPNPF
ncbi:hypothetical protein MA16_Dca003310 [Dendrobium catenatum]|uniref:Uncharacterized protein n=1 Tax=Dendrobium catenatum TaxID=906689 RepID=A0A2I0XCD8_9ASPA|nr:hypothetical protein MA16_Dca003310 [Dendrobium catenatum]